jgi:hypothetical protein
MAGGFSRQTNDLEPAQERFVISCAATTVVQIATKAEADSSRLNHQRRIARLHTRAGFFLAAHTLV